MAILDLLKSSTNNDGSTPAASPDSARKGVAGHPFFIPGRTWNSLPFLPSPKQMTLPPTYMSDLLLQVYFDQLHSSFPLLDENGFSKQYRALLVDRSQKRADAKFLAVFYAVCACAASLLAKDRSAQTPLPGMEYYENATLMQLRSMGEACVEQIQCLALLSHCASGWNTLSHAWKYAGQAVRAAQELGFHVNDPECS